jgi:hypothetical protein
LEKDNFGALWDINTDSRKAFGFSNESKDLRIEVDVKFVVLWMSDYQSGLKTSFSFLNFMGPFLSPEIFEREEGITNLVIHLHESS